MFLLWLSARQSAHQSAYVKNVKNVKNIKSFSVDSDATPESTEKIYLRIGLIYIMLVIISLQVAFNDEMEDSFSRPWLFLLSEFAIGTTVHGLKFIVEPSKYLCRK